MNNWMDGGAIYQDATGSGWSLGGVGNPEFFYDHVSFEMCTNHQSEDIRYAVGFINVKVKG